MGRNVRGFAAHLVVGALALGACSNEVVQSDGVGGGNGESGSGAGGEGGGEPASTPRAIEIAVRTPATANLDRLGVLVSAPDGRLLDYFAGGSLPPSVSARDGDLVSFLYASSWSDAGGHLHTIASYRVAPGVDRIEHAAPIYRSEDEYCELASMQVRLSIPAVVGASSYFVQTSSGASQSGNALPAEVVVAERRCVGDDSDFAIFVGARGAKFEQAALVEGLAFEPGTTLDLAPTLAPPPRTELRLTWTGIGSMSEVTPHALWQGELDIIDAGPLFTPHESGNVELTQSPGAAEVVGTPMQLALGAPMLAAQARLTPPAGACARTATFFRRGESAAPFDIDAALLHEPRIVGELGYELVGEGAPGDVLRRSFRAGQVEWEVVEDPAQAQVALAPLELPAVTPLDFTSPVVPFLPIVLSHLEFEEHDGYADYVRDSRSTTPHTQRGWQLFLRCANEG